MVLYKEQGQPLQRCVSTQHALVHVFSTCECFLFFIIFFCLRCFYFLLLFFYSHDLVLDHVIKLFIVLYHALKHGDLGWMLCV